MAKEIVICPNELDCTYVDVNATKIFMAGGITGCPDWQSEILTKFYESHKQNIILINPRRENWGDFGVGSSKEQIDWEYRHLNMSDWIYFWFPKEGKCAITLFELGVALGENKNVRIGVEPGYWRELDIVEQVKHRAPWLKIHKRLTDLYFPVL